MKVGISDLHLMRSFFVLSLTATLLFAAPAHADQILGPSQIDGSNRVLLPGGPTLGLWKSGQYTATPDQVATPGTGGYWLDRPKGAAITRLNDRVFIGSDATAWPGIIAANGTTWPWTMGQGIFGYLPRNAMVWASNPFGTIGILSSSHTGDSSKLPGEPTSGCCAIPFASLILNDNATKVQPAWNYYATAVRTAGAGETHNFEFDILNATSSVVRVPVYGNNPAGITIGGALQAGGEGAPYNNPSNPPYPNVSASSAALVVSGNGTTFDKGIVIKSAGISPTADGSTVAVDMPAGHLLRWVFDASDATGAYITSFVSNVVNQMGMVFSDTGVLFQNRAGDLMAQVALVKGAVNRPVLSGSTIGVPVNLYAAGRDDNIDLNLSAKGTGTIRPSRLSLPFSAPVSSSAKCAAGEIRSDGAYVYVCAIANSWRRAALSAY
ncbi:hypothetical protein FV219_10005 [Methylobacterium sp. WL122]|nr:hypothetical protein FV219_10005 [Methylobacterium sp. WL122]